VIYFIIYSNNIITNYNININNNYVNINIRFFFNLQLYNIVIFN